MKKHSRSKTDRFLKSLWNRALRNLGYTREEIEILKRHEDTVQMFLEATAQAMGEEMIRQGLYTRAQVVRMAQEGYREGRRAALRRDEERRKQMERQSSRKEASNDRAG